jgi:hypothetical protein
VKAATKEISVAENEHEDTQPAADVEVHRFTALDGLFDDDEPVEAEAVDESGDGEDVRLHGMSDFG